MNDNPDPGSSTPDPRPEEDPAGLSETELDDLLAQATSLANGLSEELGSMEEEPTRTSQESPAASGAEVESSNPDAQPKHNLEGELADLDELIATTSLELDGPAHAQSEPTAANDKTAASTDATAPTFMDELTQPEAPAEAVSEINTPDRNDPTRAEESPNKPLEESGAVAGSPQAIPGVVGTGMLGVVSTPEASRIPEVADGAAAMPAAGENTVAQPDEPDPSPSSRVLSRLLALPLVAVSRLAPVNGLLCQQGIRLLDLMDRPLQHTSVLVRRLVGWVALATMAISIIVLVISLF